MAKDKRKYTPSPEAARALAASDPLRNLMDDPNLAALCKHYEDQKEQRELVKKIAEAISDVLGRQPDSAAPRKKKSRKQWLIQQITAKEFPGGHDQIEIGEIIKRVGDRLQRQRIPVPGRDTFLRALGRRKG
jgi:hypothetical protein